MAGWRGGYHLLVLLPQLLVLLLPGELGTIYYFSNYFQYYNYYYTSTTTTKYYWLRRWIPSGVPECLECFVCKGPALICLVLCSAGVVSTRNPGAASKPGRIGPI